jgi:copper(I)-binding protein
MKTKWISLFAVVLLLSACQPKAAGLSIRDAWARPATSGNNSAVYFVINNPGDQGDSLLSASTDIAQAAELHMSMVEGDVMTMKKQDQVAVPAGGDIGFEPGGLHVMLIGLNQDLKVGDTFSLTLNFAKAGSRKLTVTVKEQ